jgi:hypothetical protein
LRNWYSSQGDDEEHDKDWSDCSADDKEEGVDENQIDQQQWGCCKE